MTIPVVSSVGGAGLGARAAATHEGQQARCLAALGTGAGTPAVSLYVPGRIEILGKHTDYAGGRSLLCAVEAGFCVVARPRADDTVSLLAVESGERFACRVEPDVEPRMGHWSNYPATVVRRIARNFPAARTGAEIAFVSDLPPAAGLSSSSAFVIAVFGALAAINRLAAGEVYRSAINDRHDLAAYLATIENGRTFRSLAGDRGVGTCGGSEDHTAILCCRSAMLSQYAFAPVRHEADVAFPPEWVIVVADSGVAAEKTGAARDAYNRVSWLAAGALEAWNVATGRGDVTLAEAIASDPDAPSRLTAILERVSGGPWPAAALAARVRQFCLESLELVPAARAAIAAGDASRLGGIVDASQHAAEVWLGNQVPETMFLASSARELGAVAASAFGAGFGGSVWAIVPAADAKPFVDRWGGRYATAFPARAARARFLVTRPGPAAFAVDRLRS